MPKTKTLTVESLIAEYAEPLAEAMDLTADDYEQTPDGFIQLLETVSDLLGSHDTEGEWISDARDKLVSALTHEEGSSGRKKLLKEADGLLYEAKSDLVLR